MEPDEDMFDEDKLFAELMADEEEFFAADDDVVFNACYLEYTLEDWPLLTQLNEAEKVALYDTFAEALQVAQSPAQVIGVKGANLHLLVHQSVDLSMTDIEGILDSVCNHILQSHPGEAKPEGINAESVYHRDIPQAVTRIGGKVF